MKGIIAGEITQFKEQNTLTMMDSLPKPKENLTSPSPVEAVSGLSSEDDYDESQFAAMDIDDELRMKGQ